MASLLGLGLADSPWTYRDLATFSSAMVTLVLGALALDMLRRLGARLHRADPGASVS
ncbi:MAG: hypothetical protein H6712_24450 [Myxococcales bacterium]|nr:hypothetical protein [Myxococcales bacterium]MCB9717030.1 hypothetical protein [Myxococcales bacterium]